MNPSWLIVMSLCFGCYPGEAMDAVDSVKDSDVKDSDVEVMQIDDCTQDLQLTVQTQSLAENTHDCQSHVVSWKLCESMVGIDHYQLERDDTPIKIINFDQETDANGYTKTTYAHYIVPGASYTYRVRALSEQGDELALSDPVEIVAEDCQSNAPATQPLSLLILAASLGDFRDKPPPYAPETIHERVFSGPDSLIDFFTEVSYGQVQFKTIDQVSTWLPLELSGGDYCQKFNEKAQAWYQCDIRKLAKDIESLAARTNNIDPSHYDRVYIAVHGFGPPGYEIGHRYLLFNAVHAVDKPTIAHEFGHTFNLLHAGQWDCPEEILGPSVSELYAGDCKIHRYGDSTSIMGAAGPLRHYNAWHKYTMGFFGNDRVITVQSPGIYSLMALESPTDEGAIEIRIPLDGENPSKVFYSLEYRSGSGFDAAPLNAYEKNSLGPHGFLVDPQLGLRGVLVHLHRDYPDARLYTSSGDSDTLLIKTLLDTEHQDFHDPYRNLHVRVIDYAENRRSVTLWIDT